MTDPVLLSLAIGEYDHVQALCSGAVTVKGARLNIQNLPVPDIFARFTRFREWDISEMSLAMYVSLLSQGDKSLTAIPVFPSRMFRQSAFFVRKDGSIKSARDLKGGRIGFPDWSHTAGVYARGFLAHECGVALDSVEWVEGSVNATGHAPHIAIAWPAGFKVTKAKNKSLNDMLIAGELDAIISSHTPDGALGADPALVRLFSGGMADEADYYRQTGIFPIMHVVAIRSEIYEASRWLAANLCHAFEAAKQDSLRRMADSMVSRYPFPWMYEQAAAARALFGQDFWPYGVARNTVTLTKFLTYCQEQGVSHRPVALDELFAPETVGLFGHTAQ
ncbi:MULTISPECIES: hypothetical protein [unclassified Chelatococcus]|uniref:hypothetical protein n=1 Tax=unclassified Chelatococcus TaxID=2638111 RepID=UPI001BCE1982|nr:MULTISPECIES: hypothetical protein [unclassified Chelatococcus]MBS7700136.1 hypothetical protein [Chelatococcus sp. YT9]MBX3556829.1 hypothetical protein [Chelatococcus sp.]